MMRAFLVMLLLGLIGAASVLLADRAGPPPAAADPAPPGPPPAPVPPAPAAHQAPVAPAPAGPQTVIADHIVVDRLLGEHPLSLQWISWDTFGRVTVENDHGLYRMRGEQRLNGDYLTLDGVIKEVSSRAFVFEGTLVTRVSHIANGAPCTRTGPLTFRITKRRKYWRMAEMNNPCDGTPRLLDYVDVYFPQLDPD